MVRAKHLDIDTLIDNPKTKVVVCCGSGGVGKTTTAAALALRAAERGRTTVVLTIDPARRLAQALGLEELGNVPKRVELDGFEPAGELWAMMLDMRRTFDDMIIAHSEPGRADELLASPFYQTVSTSFSGTQEYMAMEKLGQLVADGEWDLIIVDTPPSRSALDFLDAPKRLSNALDSRLIKLLTSPARASGWGVRKAFTAGLAMATKAISTVIGGQLLTDASAFMQAFNSTAGGFKERATKTAELLRSPGTSFLVVAAPESDALREASYFVERLSEESMPLQGLVANRTHPVLAELPGTKALAAAESLERDGNGQLAAAVLRLHADRVALDQREQRLLARFTRAHPGVPMVKVPALPSDVSDIAGLRVIGERLSGNGAAR
ncbi:MAG: AAA family ATPase [Actinophytocola sp.]|nr:AAA family ATPase [Actinophytocola sp.]